MEERIIEMGIRNRSYLLSCMFVKPKAPGSRASTYPRSDFVPIWGQKHLVSVPKPVARFASKTVLSPLVPIALDEGRLLPFLSIALLSIIFPNVQHITHLSTYCMYLLEILIIFMISWGKRPSFLIPFII